MVLAVLWVLQTVFLQAFYDSSVKGGAHQAATQIEASWTSDDPATFSSKIDQVASDKSLLVLVTDWNGTVLYSTDEHNAVYRWKQAGAAPGEKTQVFSGSSSSARNAPDGMGNGRGMHGFGRNQEMTQGFSELLARLKESPESSLEYQDEDGSLYVYGSALASDGASGSACEEAGNGAVLYLSTMLQPVGATASAIRLQLVAASVVALALAFALAFALSRGFSQPVEALTRKAQRMAEGPNAEDGGDDAFQAGFCSELDDLAVAMDDASAELAQVEERRREFLANISHDLRTPLTLIRGYAEAARDDAAAGDEVLEDDLDIIVRESDRLSTLVNEVLDYSVLKGDAVQFDRSLFNASAMVESVAEAFSQTCAQDGLVLNVAVEENVAMFGDESRLTRVAFNLIDNAVSHSPSGGTVSVALSVRDKMARFQVSDQGEGIPADELDHVWDRYFTKKQAKRNMQGSGLGLAISREILEAHQARYGAESALGEGSTFWFELPLEGDPA